MTVHRIMAPDWKAGWQLRAVEWDDDAGTVAGDHSAVPYLAKDLAAPTPLEIQPVRVMPAWNLEDPAHDPADFLALALYDHDIGSVFRSRVQLPESLRGVEPTPPPPGDTPPGVVN